MPMPPERFGPTIYALLRLPRPGTWRVYVSLRRGATLATAAFAWRAHAPGPLAPNHAEWAASPTGEQLGQGLERCTRGNASAVLGNASAGAAPWVVRSAEMERWPTYTAGHGAGSVTGFVLAVLASGLVVAGIWWQQKHAAWGVGSKVEYCTTTSSTTSSPLPESLRSKACDTSVVELTVVDEPLGDKDSTVDSDK